VSAEQNDNANETQDKKQPERSALRQSLKDIADPFRSLASSPRALWGVYVSYLLEGLVYFGILTILGKYLSENVGLADLHAGWVYSGFTGGITLAMRFLGGVADRIGVRRAMLLALGMMVVGRTLLGTSGAFFAQGAGPGSPMFFVVILGLFVVVLGYGTYQPAAYSAVKKFTTKKTASMGYAMIYGLMNLGAFFSGIISPPIRKSLGIESVFWVYTGVSILAFLSVLFILTPKVTARDTLTNIDAADKKTAADATSAKQLPKLMTPKFAVLIVASLVSVAMIVTMVLTAEPGPGQQPLRDVKYQMQRLDLDLGDAETAEQPALIATAADKIDELATDTTAPTYPDAELTVDQNPFTLATARLLDATTVMRAYADLDSLSTEYHLGSADSAAVIGALRTLGLTYMATAYSVVSPVDAEVLDNLRNRIKEAGADEPDPLSDADRETIRRLVELAPVPTIDLLLETTAVTQRGINAVNPDYVVLFGTLLQAEIDHLTQILTLAQSAIGNEAAAVEDLLKEHLLEAAVFYTADLPDLVKSGTGITEDEKNLFQKFFALFSSDDETFAAEPNTFTALGVFTTWLGGEMTSIDHLDAAVGGAVKMPGPATFTTWAKRYGVWLLAMVVFLVLLGANMLSKRPDHPFHDKRFVFFIFVLIPVQTLFAHNWLTLPYYINRAFGGTGVGENFEFFSNLNPILIFFLAPMVAAITVKAKVYPMMIWGTLVMAAPTFLLTLPPTPTFLLSYILLMSIGEAMWQPRFLQWVAEIAPEGQTGTYMGIGQFPWFLTKVLTGLYSGYFLSQYCPMVGPQNTQFMWLIYALIAMISPIALILARGWMMKGMRTAKEA